MRCLPVILWLVLIAVMISATAALTIVATRGRTGRESLGRLLLGYGGVGFLLFGIGAALPMLVSRIWRRSCLAAFAAFGAGGGVSGSLIAILFVGHCLGGSQTAVIVVFAIPFTLPWLLGAFLLKVGQAKMAG
jgi:hypothetical protein